MRKPNFLIIGAQKGGSTWLYDVLASHHEVFLPKKVELLHFSNKNCNDQNMLDAYAEHFNDADDSYVAVGEKTPSYLWSYSDTREYCKPHSSHNLNIVEDVVSQLGDEVKIISSIRHPVIRAISAFFHHVQRDRVEPGTSISDHYSEFGLIDMGFYAQHLKPWYKNFGESNNLTLIMERDVISNPTQGIVQVSEFLHISSKGTEYDRNKASNVGLKKIWKNGFVTTSRENSPIVTASEIKFLVDLYQDDMNELRELLDDDLLEWKKIDKELLNFSKFCDKEKVLDLASKLKKEHSVFGLNNPHQLMLELGIDLSANSVKMSANQAVLEPPVRISNTNLLHNSTVGAFSYLTDGAIYNTEIGRYCSIAKAVNIGQSNHPMDWLSTNPFQYEQTFRFRHGALFPYADSYSEYKVPAENRTNALNSIRKPKTIIGHDVWIGHGVIVTAGVKIGNGAVIGAGSVVTKNVLPYSVVGGVPAKHIKFRFEDNIIKQLNKIEWWNYAPWSLFDVNFNNIESAINSLKCKKAALEILPYSIETITLGDVKEFCFE